MNVLFVTGIFPPDIGGPATYTDEMANELFTRGHDVAVVTLSDDVGRITPDNPIEIHRLARHRNKVLRTFALLKTVKHRDEWADIIYAQGLQIELAWIRSFLETPVVARVVGDKAWEVAYQRGWARVPFDRFQTERFGLRAELLRTLRSVSLARLDRIVAASDYFAECIASWGVPESRIHRIDNFVQQPEDLPTIALPGGNKDTVVTVGRLVEWKRVDILVDAIANLDGVDLVIVGDGPERDRWAAHAQDRCVDDRVYFVGKKPNPEALAFVREADVFALPTTWESFAIVVLEAMAVGTPVVATDIGGPNEIIDDCEDGVLVAPEDPAALAAGIDRVLSNPGFARDLTENATETLEGYSLERVTDQVEELLAEVGE